MNRLKKIAAVAGLVALIASWPFMVGLIAEKATIRGINEHQSDDLTLELLDYQRGYIHADAKTQVTITQPDLLRLFQRANVPPVLLLEHHITHHALSLEIASQFTPDTEKALAKVFSVSQFKMTLLTDTSISGKTTFDANISDMKNDVFSLQAGQISGYYSHAQWQVAFAAKTLMAQLSNRSLDATRPYMRVQVSEGDKESDGIHGIDWALDAQNLIWHDAQRDYQLKQLALSFVLQPQASHYDMNVAGQAAQLDFNDAARYHTQVTLNLTHLPTDKLKAAVDVITNPPALWNRKIRRQRQTQALNELFAGDWQGQLAAQYSRAPSARAENHLSLAVSGISPASSNLFSAFVQHKGILNLKLNEKDHSQADWAVLIEHGLLQKQGDYIQGEVRTDISGLSNAEQRLPWAQFVVEMKTLARQG
ncbi:hypothetical protein VST7929_01241 [Vibrio stylophorae]|uniref:DUF945 family protein n=1 Tax=Vibrio stylophorae TaxID=659351 RepID=A0ABM8ZSX6_9VIBR|nr:DUF945 family protein [Vibrio stylophorae]CAH0533375.1 hypothetical protein VST7929_01241 [Vibrio stylophorae]